MSAASTDSTSGNRFVSEHLLVRVKEEIVGLSREAEILAVSLASGRHVVLEGPPGTGKSTLLRVVAGATGVGVEFVEGNAELTPARLVGYYDPAMIMQSGYQPQAFVEGPLLKAMREGSLIYVEELNRVPEETLNVLITALAEGEIHVPRLGSVSAAEGFRLIAAMNPFDAVGTARVSQSIHDRVCRIAIGYQDEKAECLIVKRATGIGGKLCSLAVALVRGTRDHPQVRIGSSVRGAIDMVLVARGLCELRGESTLERATLLDAAVTAISGRIQLEDDCRATPEEIITQLLDALLDTPGDESEDTPGKALGLGPPQEEADGARS